MTLHRIRSDYAPAGSHRLLHPFLLLWLLAGIGCAPRLTQAPAPAPAGEQKSLESTEPPPATLPVAAALALDPSSPEAALFGGFDSAECLSRAALAALQARDEKALHALRVSARFYREIMWPQIKAEKGPKHTIPVDFHWDMLQRNSKAGVRDVLGSYGGTSFELLEVIPESTRDYGTFKLYLRVKLRVRDSLTNREHAIRAFGSIVEFERQFRILGFPS